MIVELLPLDLSEVPVRLVNTDSKDGFTLRTASVRLETPPVRYRTGRRYTELASSRLDRLVALPSFWWRRSEPRVLGLEVVTDSLASNMRLKLGKKRPSSLSLLR